MFARPCPYRWAFVLGVLFLLTLMGPGWSQGSDPPQHAPIHIQGDADLCEGGASDAEDGMADCGAADGSAERPYVIADLLIEMDDDGTCYPRDRVGAPVPGCGGLVSCDGADSHYALVAVCGTRRHLVLERLTLRLPSDHAALSAIVLDRVENVTLRNVTVETLGRALLVRDSPASVPDAYAVHVAGLVADERNLIDADSGSGATTRPVVEVVASDVVIEETTVRAYGRTTGIDVRSDGTGREHRFRLAGSTVRGAGSFGVSVDNVTSVIHGGRFFENGLSNSAVHDSRSAPAPVGEVKTTNVPHAALQIRSYARPVVVTDNEIEVRGAGLSLVASGPGQVEGNRFWTDAQGAQLAFVSADEACLVGVHYNDLSRSTLRFVNNGFDCAIDARWNWWGDPEGPHRDSVAAQADGRFTTDPWLALATDMLPVVTIEGPADGAEAWDRIDIRGTASAAPSNDLVRIEYTRVADVWKREQVAEGLETWVLPVDLEKEPIGPLRYWLRGCGTIECGPPVSVAFQNIRAPIHPIALLSVTPRLAAVGDEVVLDATASYSPRGLPIDGYRFQSGEGEETDWVTTPMVRFTYGSPGVFSASVQVQDGAGRVSPNPMTVLVHVREAEDTATDELGSLPGPAPAYVLALLVILAKRRRGRS